MKNSLFKDFYSISVTETGLTEPSCSGLSNLALECPWVLVQQTRVSIWPVFWNRSLVNRDLTKCKFMFTYVYINCNFSQPLLNTEIHLFIKQSHPWNNELRQWSKLLNLHMDKTYQNPATTVQTTFLSFHCHHVLHEKSELNHITELLLSVCQISINGLMDFYTKSVSLYTVFWNMIGFIICLQYHLLVFGSLTKNFSNQGSRTLCWTVQTLLWVDTSWRWLFYSELLISHQCSFCGFMNYANVSSCICFRFKD